MQPLGSAHRVDGTGNTEMREAVNKRRAEDDSPTSPRETTAAKKALLDMHRVGATPGGVQRLPVVVVEEEEAEEALEAEEASANDTQGPQPMIGVVTQISPREAERLVQTRDANCEEQIINDVLKDANLLQIIVLVMSDRANRELRELQGQNFEREKKLSLELRLLCDIFAAKALMKFKFNRARYPTDNELYQTAPDWVVINAIKVVIMKTLEHRSKELSPSYIRFCREQWPPFECMVQDTLNKLCGDKEVLQQVRHTLVTDDETAKVSLRTTFSDKVKEERSTGEALDKLYRFLADPQYQGLRPLFIDQYVYHLDLKITK